MPVTAPVEDPEMCQVGAGKGQAVEDRSPGFSELSGKATVNNPPIEQFFANGTEQHTGNGGNEEVSQAIRVADLSGHSSRARDVV